VPSKEERCSVARNEPRGEFGEHVDHALAAEIGAPDDLEPEPSQRVTDRLCVIGCLQQLPLRREVGITVVANHKCDALLGPCVGLCQSQQNEPESKSQVPTHAISSRYVIGPTYQGGGWISRS
jgi:hypothetical protein